LVLALSLLAIPFVAELGLRWLLFGDDPLARRFGAGLRHAELYTDFSHDEAFWLLHARFDPALLERLETYTRPDPLLGWRSSVLLDGGFEHQAESLLGERRPVLFYGASFVTPDYTLRLLETDKADTHGLLTFGIGGFGLGQAWLLERETVPRFEGRRPLVLFGVVVDADLPRAAMRVREGPKPSFSMAADGTLIHRAADSETMRDAVERESLGITSFLGAWLGGLQSPLPFAREAAVERRAERHARVLPVNLALIRSAHDTAMTSGGEFAVILLHGTPALRREPDWTESELISYLEREGIAYLDSRRLFDAAQQRGRDLDELFFPPGHAEENHPNEAGRALIAKLLELAIEGHRDHSRSTASPYSAALAE